MNTASLLGDIKLAKHTVEYIKAMKRMDLTNQT